MFADVITASSGTSITSRSLLRKRRTFECDVDHFDAESDVFPYPDASFDTVLCCELIEHLSADPMHMMSEINRILKPGGHLVPDHAESSDPCARSRRFCWAIIPSFFPAYIRPRKEGEEAEARHNREYVPLEDPASAHRLRASKWCVSKPANFSKSRIRNSAGSTHRWSAICCHKDFAAMEFTRLAKNRTDKRTLARMALRVRCRESSQKSRCAARRQRLLKSPLRNRESFRGNVADGGRLGRRLSPFRRTDRDAGSRWRAHRSRSGSGATRGFFL